MSKESKIFILIFDQSGKFKNIPLEYFKNNGLMILAESDEEQALEHIKKEKIGVVVCFANDHEKVESGFISKVGSEVPYIQKMLVTNDFSESNIVYSINNLHINFIVKLPIENIEFIKILREAIRRYMQISKPFIKMEQLVDITMDLVVDVEKYHQQATVDALTGVLNRRSFDNYLLRRLNMFKRKKIIFSLAMLDLDHFKSINDTYGHKAGDYILSEFSELLKMSTRSGDDFIFRYGGEEFAILSTGTDEKEMYSTVLRTLESVREKIYRFEGYTIKVTFSAGIQCISDEIDAEELVMQADKALYHAKLNGRNQIHIYNDTMKDIKNGLL